MYCIEIKNLSHKFSDQVILNNISLNIPTGSIYGFLGQNGAGKTTTLRLILGLLKKQEGKIIVLNQNIEVDRISILQKTGSLIESPSVYAHLTATENLLVWQKIYQCNQQRIEEVLNMVGLSDTGKKKAGDFSLGMKQRLGLAIAMLNSPKLLILDEPTNGLDPNGIIEMRELLIDINKKYGISILISSHLLTEIEKLVTHIGVINSGKILFEGTLAELMNKQANFSIVYFKTNDNQKALTLLPNNIVAEIHSEQLEISISTKQEIASLVRLFTKNDIDVYEIITGNPDLESAFMNLLSQ